MNALLNKLAAHLLQRSTSGGVLNGEAMLDQLYIAYVEEAGADPQEVRELFGAVEEALAPVPRELSEQLGFLICRLCALHQEAAFLDGVSLGVQLHATIHRRTP